MEKQIIENLEKEYMGKFELVTQAEQYGTKYIEGIMYPHQKRPIGFVIIIRTKLETYGVYTKIK